MELLGLGTRWIIFIDPIAADFQIARTGNTAGQRHEGSISSVGRLTAPVGADPQCAVIGADASVHALLGKHGELVGNRRIVGRAVAVGRGHVELHDSTLSKAVTGRHHAALLVVERCAASNRRESREVVVTGRHPVVIAADAASATIGHACFIGVLAHGDYVVG